MWLAHHYPEDYDRCVLVGRSHICRRCLVLYPIAFAVMVLTLSWHPTGAVDALTLVVLPLPAVIEVVAEQLVPLEYAPRRQVAVTIPLAIALGRGFAIYLDDHTSLLFWGVVVGYTAICAGAVLIAQRRRTER
jgi:hypothetical protein